ncbi:MAG: hypothetical protein AAFX78_16280 [Cyanobacteria bacterium J06638_20]
MPSPPRPTSPFNRPSGAHPGGSAWRPPSQTRPNWAPNTSAPPGVRGTGNAPVWHPPSPPSPPTPTPHIPLSERLRGNRFSDPGSLRPPPPSLPGRSVTLPRTEYRPLSEALRGIPRSQSPYLNPPPPATIRPLPGMSRARVPRVRNIGIGAGLGLLDSLIPADSPIRPGLLPAPVRDRLRPEWNPPAPGVPQWAPNALRSQFDSIPLDVGAITQGNPIALGLVELGAAGLERTIASFWNGLNPPQHPPEPLPIDPAWQGEYGTLYNVTVLYSYESRGRPRTAQRTVQLWGAFAVVVGNNPDAEGRKQDFHYSAGHIVPELTAFSIPPPLTTEVLSAVPVETTSTLPQPANPLPQLSPPVPIPIAAPRPYSPAAPTAPPAITPPQSPPEFAPPLTSTPPAPRPVTAPPLPGSAPFTPNRPALLPRLPLLSPGAALRPGTIPRNAPGTRSPTAPPIRFPGAGAPTTPTPRPPCPPGCVSGAPQVTCRFREDPYTRRILQKVEVLERDVETLKQLVGEDEAELTVKTTYLHPDAGVWGTDPTNPDATADDAGWRLPPPEISRWISPQPRIRWLVETLRAFAEHDEYKHRQVYPKETSATVPERWQLLSPRVSQAVVTLANVENGRIGRSRWQLAVPHYQFDAEGTPPALSFKKGQWYGQLFLLDNTKILVHCETQEEAERTLSALSLWVNPEMISSPENPEPVQTFGVRKGRELSTADVKAIRIDYWDAADDSGFPTWVKFLT